MKMKRATFVLVSLAFAAFGAHALRSGFSNTVQHFRPEVIDFREEGLPGRIQDGVLVYPSPADLEVGDVFIDVDGNAKKVVGIEKSGRDIYIDTVQPDIQEVLLYGEIPYQTIDFGRDDLLLDGPAGRDLTVGAAADPRGLDLTVSFERELYKNEAETALIKFGASATLKSGMSIGWKLPYYELTSWCFWQASSWSQVKGYLYGALSYDLSLKGSLSFSIGKSKETKPVLLYGFGTPTPGIEAGVGLYTKTILEGKLELTLPVTFNVAGDVGAQCTLEGQTPIMWPTDFSKWGSTSFSVLLEPSLSAEASVKQKFYLGAMLTVLGIKITEFEAGGGPYFKINGTLAGKIGYSSATGRIGPEWSTAEAKAEIGIFLDVSGKVADGKWAINVFSKEIPIITLTTAEEHLYFLRQEGARRALPATQASY
jgi:hypothetical protein